MVAISEAGLFKDIDWPGYRSATEAKPQLVALSSRQVMHHLGVRDNSDLIDDLRTVLEGHSVNLTGDESNLIAYDNEENTLRSAERAIEHRFGLKEDSFRIGGFDSLSMLARKVSSLMAAESL